MNRIQKHNQAIAYSGGVARSHSLGYVVVADPTPDTKIKLARVKAAYLEGMTTIQIASIEAVTPATIRNWLVAMDVRMRPRWTRRASQPT